MNRKVSAYWGFGLIGVAVVLHFGFCEWHFGYSANETYNIMEFSRKVYPDSDRGDFQRHPEFHNLFDRVNGLFARNSLPATRAIVGSVRLEYVDDAVREYVSVDQGSVENWKFIATIIGVLVPIILFVVGAYLGVKGAIRHGP